MPGPAPQPSALKRLKGNPGHRKLNPHEPEPLPASIRAPNGLSRQARKLWHEFAGELLALGLLTTIDRPALVLLVESFARWRTAATELADGGAVIQGEYGLQRSPWATEHDAAFKAYAAMLQQFGMTPAARTRVQITKPKAKDPMTAFLEEQMGGGAN